MKGWITQLRKGLLDYVILGALASGESYGYQLVARLKELEELEITESTIYPILNRLRSDGYVKVREAPSADGPARRYFSLTTIGKYRVRDMDEYWESICHSLSHLRQGIEEEEEADHEIHQAGGHRRQRVLSVRRPEPGRRAEG